MIKTIFDSKITYLIIFLYFIVLLWWFYLQTNSLLNTNQAYLFNWFYGFIPLLGAIIGIYISFKKWGGIHSVVGRGLLVLALGLLGQWFGLQVWTYYNLILHIEVPYPSLADFGYFFLIPAYTYAAWMFAVAAGARISLKTLTGKFVAVIIPIIMLSLGYLLFIRDIGFGGNSIIRIFFDIGYPLGEVLPISIAIFTLTMTNSLLGGAMRSRILYLIFAFTIQFLTEYLFLYMVGTNSYQNGGFNDILYATSYTVMSIGLITFNDYGTKST